MRKIDSIIVHCSATKAGQDFTAADIDRWHRERGFNGIGYHYVIRLDGRLEKGREIDLPGAHCKGWNERSIGLCYIGGLDENGHPADTRTNVQKRVLLSSNNGFATGIYYSSGIGTPGYFAGFEWRRGDRTL